MNNMSDIDNLNAFHVEHIELETLYNVISSPTSFNERMAYLEGTISRYGIDIFYSKVSRYFYDVIAELGNEHDTVDTMRVVEAVRSSNKFTLEWKKELIGSIQDVMKRGNPTTPIETSCEYLVEYARQRKLANLAINDIINGLSIGLDSIDIASLINNKLDDPLLMAESDVASPIDVLDNLISVIDVRRKDPKAVVGVPTGLPSLDEITLGFQPSDLIYIAGRPSMGKTALALSIMLNMILEGIPVGFFSLEMTKDSLYVRLLSILTKIPVEDVMRGAVTQEQYDKLKDAAAKLKELPLYIDDTPGVTAEYIRSVTYMWKRMHGIKCAFVDYIGLVTPLKKLESRERDVAHASQSFKSTAKKFNIPMVILSQLNRALEQRADRRPILSDLRESGSIEQDADVVIFVHRDEMYRSKKESAMPNEWVDPDTGEYVEKDSVDQNAEVIVAKQRNGKLGDVKMYYKKRYTLFTENR